MIFIAGNGGLCSVAEHFTAELMGKFAFDVFIPCMCLTSPSSLITALANDIGYDNVFAHQIEVLGKPGDTFIGLTTSHSKNIMEAVEVAKKRGMCVILWDGDNLKGDTTALKQEYALHNLHELAYTLKLEAKNLL